MKMRISSLLILVFVAMLSSVACRGREQPTVTQSPVLQQLAPSPAAGQTQTPFGGPPPAGLPVTSFEVSVTPASFTGECPKTFAFIGTITANAPTTVNYQWEWGDRAIGPSGSVTFTAAGTQRVTTERTWGASGNSWARLRLTSHGNISSNQAAYTLTCSSGGGQPQQTPPVGTAAHTPPLPASAAQPDLIIDVTTVTTTTNPGEVRIHIVALNQGGPISAAFTIRWHPHQKDLTQVGCSEDFYKLNQNEWTVDCTYTYPANIWGEMHWVAAVDAENDVKNESNEKNNESTGTVTIAKAGGAPPASSSSSAQSSSNQPLPPPLPAGQAPSAPTNCRTRVPTSGSVQIILDWDHSGQPAPSGFRIYQGTTSLEKTVGPNDKSASLSNLTRGVQYHFDVRAYNASGESRANACSVDVTPPR